jgi:hypothetical protein
MTAGLFAALASVFGKLALDPNFLDIWLAGVIDNGPDSNFSTVWHLFIDIYFSSSRYFTR